MYVSQRGLEHVLKELQEGGLLTKDVASSRKSIKRARNDDLAAKATQFGSLIQDTRIQCEDGSGRTVNLPYIAPAALLAHIAQQPTFGRFLCLKLLECFLHVRSPLGAVPKCRRNHAWPRIESC